MLHLDPVLPSPPAPPRRRAAGSWASPPRRAPCARAAWRCWPRSPCHGPSPTPAGPCQSAPPSSAPCRRPLRGPVGKFRLTRPGLAAIQHRLDLVPVGAEVVVVELAQRRDDPLPRAALGADGFAERPVLVGLSIDASAVLAEEYALVFRAGRRVPRGGSPRHEPFDLRCPPFRAFQKIHRKEFGEDSAQLRNLG